ncbi:17-beta-hydroxysteroid dehydrogenase type 6, partial [Nannochloropsis gaditana CCMP526]|uniref:17-beta-hydroxysteroid dehydrogenase type 6 n=1 Tax=Nannochloropsis gaditana (strain CCMP526) TaxID=1093141 RepID=UPI00029F7460
MNGDRQVTNVEKRASFSSLLLQLPNILLQATNNVLHLPILFDLAWYVVWAFYIAMAPFYLLCHILFFVLDTLFAIYSFARQEVKSLILFMKGKNGEAREERAILITGCDSGFGFDLAMALAAESLACREEEKKEGRREEPRGRRWKVYAGCLSATGREQITQRAPEAAAH